MRRSAVSITSNIAEGAARQGKKEFVQFLYVAVGSANELDTQLEISKTIQMGDSDRISTLQHQVTNVIMMMRGLSRAMKGAIE